MTVYLKGLSGRVDRVEENVQKVTVDDMYIRIDYKKPYKYGLVSGVAYFNDEMTIERIEEGDTI